jgi:hypothetical protein
MISVVIPTRSRARYLRHAVATALAAGERSGRRFEVVVADNCSDDDTCEVVRGFSSPNLRWTRSEERVSMRANFERALQFASGTHFCFIGDDDAVTLSGLSYLNELLDRTDADSVQWPTLNYSWPGGRPGSLKLRFSSLTGLYAVVDAARVIESLRNATFYDYHVGGNIYHGCISRRLVERVTASAGGPYFHASSPDVYASMQNLHFVGSGMVRAMFPVTLGGASPKSNTASLERARPEAGGAWDQWLKESSEDPFQCSLPSACRSVPLITLDCFLHACRRHGMSAEIDRARWWSKVRRDLEDRIALELTDAHVAWARALLGDEVVDADPPFIRQTRGLEPIEGSSEAAEASVPRETATVRRSLSSVLLSGGDCMGDISCAVAAIERLTGGGTGPRPATTAVSSELRRLSILQRAWRQRWSDTVTS